MRMNVSIISTSKVQELLSKHINKHGHVIESTSNDYHTGIQDLQGCSADIVVIDAELEMSEQKLKSLLYKIMNLDYYAEIVLLNEYIEPILKKQFMSLGIKYFIEKPFQPARIYECLDSIESEKENGIIPRLRNYSLIEDILNDNQTDDYIVSKKEQISKQINSVRSQINKKQNKKDDIDDELDFHIEFDDFTSINDDSKNYDDSYDVSNDSYLDDIQLSNDYPIYSDENYETESSTNNGLASNSLTNDYISLESDNIYDNYVSETSVTHETKQKETSEEGYLGLPKYINRDTKDEEINSTQIESINQHSTEVSDKTDTDNSLKSKLKSFLSKR